MMMQMLSAGGMEVLTDQIREADQDNLKGYFEYEAIKATKRDASWVEDAVGKAVKAIYMLLADLPAEFDYRVIFMRRDLQEVVRSQQTMLQRRGEKGAALAPSQMVAVFEREIKKTDLWLKEQTNFRHLNVRYRDVLADPRAVAPVVREFLEFPLDTHSMAAVVDSSLYHQRSDQAGS